MHSVYRNGNHSYEGHKVFFMRYKKIHISIVVYILFIIRSHLFAQDLPFQFNQLTIDDGLSQGIVYSILRDSTGFMWFGTEDGLNRYDGYTFTVFRPITNDSTSISNNVIRDLKLDDQGNLWIGTYGGGLNLYHPETETFESFSPSSGIESSLAGSYIRNIVIHKGIIWIGTEYNGLYSFNIETKNFIKHLNNSDHPCNIAARSIRDLYIDRDENLWIGSYDSGLFKYNFRNKISSKVEVSINNVEAKSVRKIIHAKDGSLWMGTWGNGLYKLDKNRKVLKRYVHNPNDPNSLCDDRIISMLEDNEGLLWFGTDGGGLCYLDRKSDIFHSFQHNPRNDKSFTSNFVTSIYSDNQGSIWFGTWGKGINILDKTRKKFMHFSNDPYSEITISDNSVWSICEDSEGYVWVATLEGGLNKIDMKNKTVEVYKSMVKKTESSSDIIRAVIEDTYGTIWIGKPGGGLQRFNKKTKTFKAYFHDPDDSTSLIDDDILHLSLNHKGNILIGTNKGVNIYHHDTDSFSPLIRNRNSLYSLSHSHIRIIYEAYDEPGVLWIGTGNGLNRYDSETGIFKHYFNSPEDTTSIPTNKLWSIYKDSKHRLWLGTDGAGLCKFNAEDETFKQYSLDYGFPNGVIYGILEDNDGNLWLSTNKGMCKFNPETEKVETFDERDGIQSNEFNAGAYFKGASGRMYFGGINGITAFYPDSITMDTRIPPVIFTDFKIFNRSVKPGRLPSGRTIIKKSITYADHISLSYKDIIISFEFAALNYRLPERNFYKYRMDGFDQQWTMAGNRRFATYTNLPPGDYTFRLHGSNQDGNWNTIGAHVTITVEPPFWQTAWFRTLLAIGVLGVIFLAYRWRVRKIEYQKNKLEEEVKARGEELSNAYQQILQSEKMAALGSLVAGVSHEINTPIGIGVTAASHLDQKVKELRKYIEGGKITRSELQRFLGIYSESTQLILSNLDRAAELIQSFKKVSVDQSSSERRVFGIKEYLDGVIVSLKHELKRTRISVKVECESSIEIDSFPGAFSQIVTNLIMNSIHHAFDENQEGTILFEIKENEKEVIINYHDDGKGIPEEFHSRIFEPFFTTGREKGGSGLGLHIIYNLVTQRMQGKIQLERNVNKGVLFILRLPKQISKV